MARNFIAHSEAINDDLFLVALVDGQGDERKVVMRKRIAEGENKCQDCGAIKADVERVACPVQWEIDKIEVVVDVCNACWDERDLEI